MTRAAGLVALALAFALHLALFALLPAADLGPASAEAAGEGGDTLVSLAAVDGDLASLIVRWEEPPAPPPLPKPLPPPVLEKPPALPDPVAAPVLRGPGTLALPAPDVPAITEPAPTPKPKAPEEPAAKPPEAPKQEPAAKSPPKAAQKAVGSGAGAAAGDNGKDSAATLSKAQVKKLTASWGAKIRARIEGQKAYPAKAGGAAGKVLLRLVVGTDGGLRSVSVAKSSGNAALDAAALAAVKKAGRFAKAPKGLGETSFTLPISFQP